MNKPSYIIPSMADIRALPWNGFTVASTFSGCGGSSLGYRLAGFKVGYANEFVEEARNTYRANCSLETFVDGRDIRAVTADDIFAKLGMQPGELDLFDGSPPCASFSTAGSRAKGWGRVKTYSDTMQRTDDLFYEYSRLLRGIRPKTFVAENVSGLVKGVAKGYFLDILKELKTCGYRVSARVLNAAWLGVPQARQRLIFVGVRDDLGIDPVHPKPLPYCYTVRDALPHLRSVVHDTSGNRSAGEVIDRPCPTITVGGQQTAACHFKVEAEADITGTAIGREWDRMGRPGTQSEKYFQLVRPALDRPCPTITATAGQTGAAGVTHPTERRKFSIAEVKALSGCPADFVLTGTYRQQWERLGRCVPPVMMSHIAAAVRDGVLRRIKR
ncbi:MAG: DNA cytosine methyltransferase [Tepidisphaeraceae bacterium]